MLAQQKALAKLQSLLGTEITASEAARFMVEGTGIERVARGEPVTIETHEHRGPGGAAIRIREIVMIRRVKIQEVSEDGEDGKDGDDGHDGHDGPSEPGAG